MNVLKGIQHSACSRGHTGSRMSLLIALLICLFNLLVSSQSSANPHRDAKNAFVQGDLPTVVKILDKELFPKPRLRGKELEDARSLYGITQFMLGNKKKAESVFRQILGSNPDAKLDKKYLLDPAVEPLFENLKKSSSGGAKDKNMLKPPTASAKNSKNAATARSKNSSVQVSVPKASPTPPPENPRPKSESSRPVKQGPFTGLQVKVNAPRATLFADGIFIGAPDQKISLEPGVHLISASAEGYETAEIKVKIEKGKTLQLNVSLKKAGSAAPRQDVRNPAPLTSAGKSAQKKRGKKDNGLDSNQPKRALSFNQELPAAKNQNRSRSSYTDQYFQEPPPQQYSQQPPPQYNQPPPQYNQTPQYAQPPAQYPPAYQQPYPQPQYSYPPPVYSPPPVYTAPPPAYTYPDPYAQPPAYAAPQAPAYGAPNPYEEEDEAGDVNAPPTRSGGSSRSRKNSRRKGNAALAALPFGVGQFQNGDSGKGYFFLAAEAGAVGYAAYLKLKVIPDAQSKFATYREQETDLPQEEKDAAEIPREEYLKKMNSYFQYTLIGAGAVYLIGVIDAFSNLDPGPTRRRAAEAPPLPAEHKYRFAFSPEINGGMSVKFTLRLD